jgi:hypothetical protein
VRHKNEERRGKTTEEREKRKKEKPMFSLLRREDMRLAGGEGSAVVWARATLALATDLVCRQRLHVSAGI